MCLIIVSFIWNLITSIIIGRLIWEAQTEKQSDAEGISNAISSSYATVDAGGLNASFWLLANCSELKKECKTKSEYIYWLHRAVGAVGGICEKCLDCHYLCRCNGKPR
jgi:hypothetical protein